MECDPNIIFISLRHFKLSSVGKILILSIDSLASLSGIYLEL